MTDRQRGFTLLELMISMVIAGIAASAIFGLLQGQILSFSDQGQAGDAADNARAVIDTVSQRVAQAGMGIPPWDVIGPTSLALDNAAGGDAYNTCPGTDVMEFRSRDPRSAWRLVQAGTTDATLNLLPATAVVDPSFPTATMDLAWPAGSRLLLIPAPGQGFMRQVAVARPSGISVASLVPTGNNPALTVFTDGSDIFLVSSYRFRLACVDPAHPMLLLETDTDTNGDGVVNATTDVLPVAFDIEDFQVTYLIDNDGDGTVTAADAVPWGAGLTSVQQRAVKAIRVSVVGRSANQIKAGNGTASTSAPLTIENHVPVATPDNYMRKRMSETIYLQNRDTRSDNVNLFKQISNRWL